MTTKAGTKAGTKTKAASAKLVIGVDDVLAFRKAIESGNSATITKIRIAAKYLAGGASHAAVATALIEQCALSVNPVSFRGEIAQYAKAISITKATKTFRNDTALLLTRSVSNGSIPASQLDSFAANFVGTPAKFVTALKALKAETKAGKSSTAGTGTKATTKAESGESVESEESPVIESPIEDVTRLTRQLAAILDLLADNSADDYSAALDIVASFAATYVISE